MPPTKRKNEGISVDVAENKRTKIVTFWLVSMCMKTPDLSCAWHLAVDVDENEWLSIFAGPLF